MQISGNDVVEFVPYVFCLIFGGWGAFLTNERNRFIDAIKESKTDRELIRTKVEILDQLLRSNYFTRSEHETFENKVVEAIDRLSDRLDSFIDRRNKE